MKEVISKKFSLKEGPFIAGKYTTGTACATAGISWSHLGYHVHKLLKVTVPNITVKTVVKFVYMYTRTRYTVRENSSPLPVSGQSG